MYDSDVAATSLTTAERELFRFCFVTFVDENSESKISIYTHTKLQWTQWTDNLLTCG